MIGKPWQGKSSELAKVTVEQQGNKHGVSKRFANIKQYPNQPGRVDGKKKQLKRATRAATSAATSASPDLDEKKSSGHLRRTNSASSLLGLSLLLYPDKNEYDGLALDNFYGFRVS